MEIFPEVHTFSQSFGTRILDVIRICQDVRKIGALVQRNAPEVVQQVFC